MSASEDVSPCGVCGLPVDDAHDRMGHDTATGRPGKRVDYVVLGKRGGIAEYQGIEDRSRIYRTDAAILAVQLGIDESALIGSLFSCWVSPAEHGVIRSDFRCISGVR
ncbi:hypothetical protein Cs7R123_43730 [Catellatospora sp. TT07R-123]|nr:hypothetical protein Cs7R123_43730 [Catellatospora sp. TT07R-123]